MLEIARALATDPTETLRAMDMIKKIRDELESAYFGLNML